MEDLTTISMLETAPALGDGQHLIQTLPVLVLFPHNRCNCRCLMCDIWRIREAQEITAEDLQPHLESLRRLQVRWVVFSGGEPQMHSDLATLARLIRREGIRLTLLTAGLLLEAQASTVAAVFDDVIVSLDGPPEIHNRIRRVPKAFEKLERGIQALRALRPEISVRGRSTVQKANCAHLRSTIATAKELGLNSLSFLAADLTSEAFNRPRGWSTEQQATLALRSDEIAVLEREIELLIRDHAADMASGFVVESAGRLRRIVQHFRAQLGQIPPVAPVCNAPWVSTVIEADGTVRPCFFHLPLGNIRKNSLPEILNSESAVDFRRRLDIPNNPVCQRCVCSLHHYGDSRNSQRL